MTDRITLTRAMYAAYAAFDIDAIVAGHHPDVVYHVAGRHPLSGDKVGRDAVLDYMLQVSTITGGRGGFEVEVVGAENDRAVALVTGTAWSDDVQFRRQIVHVCRFEGDRVIEFWDAPLDQHAEDAFWTAAGVTRA